MSCRASVTFGVVALLFAVTGTAQPAVNGSYGNGVQNPAVNSAAPAAGGYSRAPAPVYRYPAAPPGRVPYPGYYAGTRGVPAGGYWAGGRWYGGWQPRAYYGPGIPWYPPVAAGYSPYWYGGAPYAWNPGYAAYPAPAPPPVAAVAPAPPAPPAAPPELVLKGVDFETASAELRPESTAILDGVADTVRRCNCSGVEIRGYTDSVGDRDYNRKLSEQRASAVKEYLEGHGVPAGVLTAHGFGEENPIASNSTADGRADNRRVTVQFSAPAGTQLQN